MLVVDDSPTVLSLLRAALEAHHYEVATAGDGVEALETIRQSAPDLIVTDSIMPGLDGLLHVSEIAHYRVKDVRDELKEGEQVMVKVINIDPSGKIRLSRKALLQPEEAHANGEGQKA